MRIVTFKHEALNEYKTINSATVFVPQRNLLDANYPNSFNNLSSSMQR